MSGGAANVLRWPVDQSAILGSRMGAQLGRTLHWQGLVDEAKHNEANPGRAETKAAINAALWYLGGEAAGAAGEGGAAAGTAADTGAGAYDALTAAQIAEQGAPIAAGENVGSLLSIGSNAPSTTAELGQLAAQNAGNAGLFSGSVPNSLQLAQAQQAAPVVENSVQAQNGLLRAVQDRAAIAYGRGRDALSGYNSAMPQAQQSGAPVYDNSVRALQAAPKNQFVRQLAMRQGMNMFTPQQQRPMPQGMPAPQGQPQPLTNPYQNPYGPGGNSLGLTEEQKQKLRMMGYQV